MNSLILKKEVSKSSGKRIKSKMPQGNEEECEEIIDEDDEDIQNRKLPLNSHHH